MHNLGNALLERGDAVDFEEAEFLLDRAQGVHTREADPFNCALTLSSRASLLVKRLDASADEFAANVRAAMQMYEQSQEVWTLQEAPFEWAKMEYNQGVCWNHLWRQTGNDALRQVIAHNEDARSVFSPNETPIWWATTCREIGFAWLRRTDGDPTVNLEKAATAYREGLQGVDRRTNVALWAMLQNGQASALVRLKDSPSMHRAIEIYQAILVARPEDQEPIEHARMLTSLALAVAQLPDGDRRANLTRAIELAERALVLLERNAATQQDIDRARSTIDAAKEEYEEIDDAGIPNCVADVRSVPGVEESYGFPAAL